MTFQYLIWRKEKRTEHLVFNQNSLRIIYPPSHPFIHKPVRMAVKFYEENDWRLIDSNAWKGDNIEQYMEAMRKLYPKKLSKRTEGS